MTTRLLAIALALGLSVPSGAADVPTGRLPSDVRPVAYRIDLREDPAQPRFSGHVEIDVRLNRATRSIWINGRDLAVSRAEVRVGGRAIPATYTQVADAGVARLDLASNAPAGSATLVIDYAGSFGESPAGLYRVQAGGRWYSYTQFQPIDAGTAWLEALTRTRESRRFGSSAISPVGVTSAAMRAMASAMISIRESRAVRIGRLDEERPAAAARAPAPRRGP